MQLPTEKQMKTFTGVLENRCSVKFRKNLQENPCNGVLFSNTQGSIPSNLPKKESIAGVFYLILAIFFTSCLKNSVPDFFWTPK